MAKAGNKLALPLPNLLPNLPGVLFPSPGCTQQIGEADGEMNLRTVHRRGEILNHILDTDSAAFRGMTQKMPCEKDYEVSRGKNVKNIATEGSPLGRIFGSSRLRICIPNRFAVAVLAESTAA